MLIPALIGFGVAAAAAPFAFVGLRWFGVLDVPTDRSSHQRPIPRGGGVAVAAGATAAVIAPSSALSGQARVVGVLIAASCFGLVGLAEDVAGVAVPRRLALQFGAALVALPWLLSALSGGTAWRIGFTVWAVAWLVAFSNAFNFMDGIDGLAVGQSVVAGASWTVVGLAEGLEAFGLLGAVLAAAALGFAPLNLPRARMFLGDVGSYFVGAWLAATAIVGLRAGLPVEAVLAPLALFLTDTGTTLARRIARREPFTAAHRQHVYQRLTGLGWTHVRTSGLATGVMAACAALGSVSLTGSTTARVAADAVVAAVLVAYVAAPDALGGARRAAAPCL